MSTQPAPEPMPEIKREPKKSSVTCRLRHRGIGLEFDICGSTILGKESVDHIEFDPADPPLSFTVLTKVPESNGISKKHAALLAPDWITNVYAVQDLNAVNGTYVNGMRTEPLRPTPLYPGDILGLSEDVNFEVEYVPREVRGQGVCVGYHPGDLRGVEQDVKKLHAEFARRGFSITQLLGDHAQHDAMLDVTRVRAKATPEGETFVLYFSGHGNESGICLLPDKKHLCVAPEELFETLKDTPCRKLLVLDGCYTGAFEKDLPERTFLIGTKAKAYEQHIAAMAGAMTSYVQGGKPYMGSTSRSIYSLLKSTFNEISGKQMVKHLTLDGLLTRKQEICAAGDETVLLPRRS